MKKIENEEWYKDLKIKGMTDYAGHYVEMKQVDKNQKVVWYWNDGALTYENFKRDRLFNFMFGIVKFYRLHKKLCKFIILVFYAFIIAYVITKIVSIYF